MTMTAPSNGFPFYVGVGIPTKDRFSELRADALVMGDDLPELTAAELAAIPDEVKDDPVFVPRGYLHASPEDQATCAHLDAVMTRASRIRNGRCDFYEPRAAVSPRSASMPSDALSYPGSAARTPGVCSTLTGMCCRPGALRTMWRSGCRNTRQVSWESSASRAGRAGSRRRRTG